MFLNSKTHQSAAAGISNELHLFEIIKNVLIDNGRVEFKRYHIDESEFEKMNILE